MESFEEHASGQGHGGLVSSQRGLGSVVFGVLTPVYAANLMAD
jgi:hypothetical protein